MMPAKSQLLKQAYTTFQHYELNDLARNFFSPDTFNNIMNNASIDSILDYTLGIAYAVFALCFLIGLFNISVRDDNLSTQGVFTPLRFFIKAALVKIMIDVAPALFKQVMNGALMIFQKIVEQTEVQNPSIIDDKIFVSLGNQMWYVPALFSWGFTWILTFILLALSIFILMSFASLVIKVIIYYLIAPIGVATLISDETSLAGRNFLRTLFAFAGELIIYGILIALYLAMTQGAQEFFSVKDSLTATRAGKATYGLTMILFNGEGYLQEVVKNREGNAGTLPLAMASKLFLTLLFSKMLAQAEIISKKITGAS